MASNWGYKDPPLFFFNLFWVKEVKKIAGKGGNDIIYLTKINIQYTN